MTSLDLLWGSGELDSFFRGGDRSVVPWPRAGKLKGNATAADDHLSELVRSPVRLVQVDPRELHASQSYLVGHHAQHYLETDLWERLGRTSADMHLRTNRFPIITPDHRGRLVIRTGHHRSFAALVRGEPVLARVVEPGETPIAVTPRLPYGPRSAADLAALGLDDEQVADRLSVACGGPALLNR